MYNLKEEWNNFQILVHLPELAITADKGMKIIKVILILLPE